MSKKAAALLGFFVLVIGTPILIWTYALPDLKPVIFPQVASGSIEVGPMRHKRMLTDAEVSMLNTWFTQHKGGWGPLSTTPPSSGDSRVTLFDDKGKEVLDLTLWTGISAADWNDTVFVESPDGQHVRSEHFSKKQFAPLRMLVDQHLFRRTDFP
ncbi:hypothetical protein [Acetobacter thailandicus]|uniref:Uncharacterized protein n=1 Tax=Acetobacter thailandicus TaxID=1502842 RepID=A0ABT3QDS4_9PROT|nr:hypothetical protein [Acetobacter thailandicus]MCX2563430.1 hypothetical protein [Acetobacter thailandicus]NHN94184.1 hypothetical protein [Acetobacter thailandicus]